MGRIDCHKTSVRNCSYSPCHSPEECSSQDDFSHKNNAKNVSKSNTNNNIHTALVPILSSQARSFCGHGNVLVILWLAFDITILCCEEMLVQRYFPCYQPATLWCFSATAWEEIKFWWKWERGPQIISLRHILYVRISVGRLGFWQFLHFLQCY